MPLHHGPIDAVHRRASSRPGHTHIYSRSPLQCITYGRIASRKAELHNSNAGQLPSSKGEPGALRRHQRILRHAVVGLVVPTLHLPATEELADLALSYFP